MEAIVKNGVALVTTEGCIVGDYSFSKMQSEGPFRIDSDEYIPQIKQLAETVHKHTCLYVLKKAHLKFYL